MRSASTLFLALLLLAASMPRPDAPVADAVMRGEDTETIRALIQQGEDVNAAQGDGMTALHWAAEQGAVELVEMLIHAGANVEAVTRLGAYTPLHLASEMGNGEVVRMLLEAGGEPNARTTTGGVTPLHFAAASGDATAVAALLEHDVEVDARASAWGQTPLIFAAARDNMAVVEALLESGADAGITTYVVDLPAREAVDRLAGERRDEVFAEFAEQEGDGWRPRPDQVQAAVRAARAVQLADVVPAADAAAPEDGGDGEGLEYSELVGSHGGLTALLHAVREGHAEAALTLVDAGVDINQVSSGDGTSPLLLAMINGHFDLGLMLLERGADPTLASAAGTTPLYAALNARWAPRSRYPQQHAHLLQEASYLDVMERLLEAGADPNVRLEKHLWYMSYTFDLLGVDTRGATPFWRAAYATDVDAMKLLVAYGADPNVPTEKPPERRRSGREGGDDDEADPSGLPPVPVGGPGVWPIHAASGVGYGEGYAANAHRHVPDGWLPAVQYLVEELGADVNARDHNGYNAVHHAAARGDNELILYLAEQNADVMAVSREGQTTADMANGPVQRISPFPRSVALLESLGSVNNHNCVSC